jgi:hypothetical protein
MEQRQLLGYIGSATLFIGAFLPLISVPILGQINYYNNGKGDGVIIVVLAIISFILTLTNRQKGLILTGALSLGVIGYTYFNLQNKLSEIRNSMDYELAGNPFKGLTDLAMNSIKMEWGWAVLVVGGLLLIAAGMSKNKPKEWDF